MSLESFLTPSSRAPHSVHQHFCQLCLQTVNTMFNFLIKIIFFIKWYHQPLKNPSTKSCSQFSFPPLPISFSLLSPICLFFTFPAILSLFYTVALSLMSTLPVSQTCHPRGKPEHLPYRVDMIKTLKLSMTPHCLQKEPRRLSSAGTNVRCCEHQFI